MPSDIRLEDGEVEIVDADLDVRYDTGEDGGTVYADEVVTDKMTGERVDAEGMTLGRQPSSEVTSSGEIQLFDEENHRTVKIDADSGGYMRADTVTLSEQLNADRVETDEIELGDVNATENATPGAMNVSDEYGEVSILLDGDNGVGKANEWTTFSDARCKSDVQPLDDPVETVTQLRGVSYEWDDDARYSFDDDRHVGFLAQELEDVVPEIVSVDEDGYRSVAEGSLTALLVEAFKDQQETVERQEATIEEQADRIDDLEARLAELEGRVD